MDFKETKKKASRDKKQGEPRENKHQDSWRMQNKSGQQHISF